MNEGSEQIVFAATIDERGGFVPERANETRGRLARWHGRHVTVKVTRFVRGKTNPQLGLYYREPDGILSCWAEWCGYDRDDMHRELKLAYLAPRLAVSRLTGEEVRELPSLADLNVEEMSTFIDRILREGRQQGIVFVSDSSE